MPETIPPLLVYAACGGASYLCGSIPFGYLIAKAVKGIDIRQFGSRNIGATNVGRVLGVRYFFLVFILDALKGFAPVFWLAPWAVSRWMANLTHAAVPMAVMSGVMALIGHLFPVTMGFKGGKGVATGAGVALALHWPACVATLGLWVLVLLATRMVSCASIMAAAGLPVAYAIMRSRPEPGGAGDILLVFFITVAVLVVYMHRSNIRRILNGTEARISWPKK